MEKLEGMSKCTVKIQSDNANNNTNSFVTYFANAISIPSELKSMQSFSSMPKRIQNRRLPFY